MRRLLGIVTATAAGLLIIALVSAYGESERRLSRTYPVAPVVLHIPNDSNAMARGEHLVRSTATCVLCHGDDLGGAVYADAGMLGVIAGPNLTRGRGGVGGSLVDADWVRAIRHGVRRDGTSMIVMPSEIYAHLSDEDLAAIIAYLNTLPPVDREVPRTSFGPLGRLLLAAGRLNILVAPKTPQFDSHPPVRREPTVAYGRYLADIAGCHGCHGYELSGGRVAGPRNLPPASNLTPAGRLACWSEAEFVQAMRTGVRPDGSTMNSFMPWMVLGGMTDDEMRAIWIYLGSVPPKAFGNK